MTSSADALRLRLRTTDAPAAALVPAIGGAWAIVLLAETTGVAAGLHHHTLLESGPPLPVAAAEFVLGWLVMLVAMMLPASMPVMLGLAAARGRVLAGFLVVWSCFGLAVFLGDATLHAVVDATPWLAAQPWLIEAGVIALAGAWQFAPLKHRGLAACRVGAHRPPRNGSVRIGLEHGLDCLGASWALMLLMFAEGFDGLGWMIVLAALMAYEVAGRHAHRVTLVAGAGLLITAVGVLAGAAGVGP